jgi:hypothetical protein
MASRLLYFLEIAYLAMDFKRVGKLALDVWEWWQMYLLNVCPCLDIWDK